MHYPMELSELNVERFFVRLGVYSQTGILKFYVTPLLNPSNLVSYNVVKFSEL